MRQNRDSHLDSIIDLALVAAEEFFRSLRRAVLGDLRDFERSGSPVIDVLPRIRETFLRFADPLVDLLVGAGMTSLIGGQAQVADALPQSTLNLIYAEPEPVFGRPGQWRFEGKRIWLPLVSRSVKSLQAKKLVTADRFERLRDEQKRRAFTVAGPRTVEAVGEVRDAIIEGISKGYDFRKIKADVDERLGTGSLGVGQLENVFRTNAAMAYSDGMDDILAHPVVDAQFPYEETLPIRDSRLTDLCRIVSRSGIQGTGIFRRDDPVYRKFRCPRHWKCRCSRSPKSVKEAAKRGIAEAVEWHRTGIRPTTPAFVPHPDVELPKGWVQAA